MWLPNQSVGYAIVTSALLLGICIVIWRMTNVHFSMKSKNVSRRKKNIA
jgi:hypothetical protein